MISRDIDYKEKYYASKKIDNVQECSVCIFDSTIPDIEFDDEGVCTYCHMVENLKNQYKTGLPEGKKMLEDLIEEIKSVGKKKKYDCVIGISGGTDSSYMLHFAVKNGLRPLAVLYDNTWNTSIATENIRKMTSALNVDLYTHVCNNKEADDIFKSFFLAGVPELDCSTDIAIAETLYRAASKHGIKYILEGHSFTTEGVAPLGNNYFDGKYVESVQKKHGSLKSIKTFPNMTFYNFMKWVLVKRIKKIRPLWYIEYSKEDAQEFLKKEYGWANYGGHHLENRLTAFLHKVWYPYKFTFDARNWSLAAAARSNIMTREEAATKYKQPIEWDTELVAYFQKRLSISDKELDEKFKEKGKNFTDYKTYKKRFERLRPLFFLLAKANLVPMSFYIKYTSKDNR